MQLKSKCEQAACVLGIMEHSRKAYRLSFTPRVRETQRQLEFCIDRQKNRNYLFHDQEVLSKQTNDVKPHGQVLVRHILSPNLLVIRWIGRNFIDDCCHHIPFQLKKHNPVQIKFSLSVLPTLHRETPKSLTYLSSFPF